jgi:hypothetical protein
MNMPFLIPTEQLLASRRKYEAERPKTHAEILCIIAREDPTVTVSELAEASGHSLAWVRKHLKLAGIALIKPQRQKTQRKRINGYSVCVCGHQRGTARDRKRGLNVHCVQGTTHIKADNSGIYKCDSSHCMGFSVREGQMIPCKCEKFVLKGSPDLLGS